MGPKGPIWHIVAIRIPDQGHTRNAHGFDLTTIVLFEGLSKKHRQTGLGWQKPDDVEHNP